MVQLQWIGKDKVINHHHDVPYKVLNKSYTFGEEKSGNKIIHGDNLEALKSLLPQYEGKIDCIYIDPPYNTGNEGWIYNDNVNDPKIHKWLNGIVGKEGEDLSRHDKWLCMMYPRLKLLEKLLCNNGIIFISIDDNEQANLRLLCDEIFGSNSFITDFFWMRTATASNLSHTVRSKMEHILCYHGGGLDFILSGGLTDGGDVPLLNASNKLCDAVFPKESIELKIKDGIYKPGKYDKVELLKNFEVKNGKAVTDLYLRGNFKWTQDTINNEINKGTFFLIKTEKFSIRFQRSEKTIKTPSNLISKEECNVGTNEEAFDTIKSIFGSSKFDYSKPVSLIKYLINMHNNKSLIVLDSFAGSGTTAHAVLDLNKQDGGNRKFILVELGDYAETITAERVKSVINGYGEGDKKVSGTGGGFDFYELGEPLFLDANTLNENVGENILREYIRYSETKQEMQIINSNNKYFLGKCFETDYYFYYEKDRVTELDYDFIGSINREKSNTLVIYADICSISDDYLSKHNIIFKVIPRDISRF